MEFTENKLDNALFDELFNEKPSADIIRELIKQGANVNAVDDLDQSVLLSAIYYYAPVADDFEIIKLLVKLGADVNYEDDTGFNCLFAAGIIKHPKLVEFLLQSGANPNCIGEDGDSLLDWAEMDLFVEECNKGAVEEMKEIIELLIKYGAKSIEDI